MQQGIPASQIVSVIPGVLAAGGTGLDMIELVLTPSTRVPTGLVISFPDPPGVGAYFGLNSNEFALAESYFAGFDNSPIKPGSLLFTQYPWAAAVPPYLRGGNISGLSLAQLKAIAPGELTISINGTQYVSSSINLASATSFSNAASLIQSALGVNDASFTGVIAEETASTTGSISDDILTVSAVASGVLVVGGVLSGAGVAANTTILNQITGPAGGVGTYQVTPGGQSVSSTTIDEEYGQLTASSVTGLLAPGQVIAGAGVTAGSTITADISGSGGAGTYVTQYQAVSSEAMTAGAASVTYDSVSGAFIITGGTPGLPGTITYGSGAIATSLLLTAATGAVLSQGAPQATPFAFMQTLFNSFQNFATFQTLFEPSISDALAFAQFTNSLDTELAYLYWAPEAGNATPDNDLATAQIIAAGYSGTAPFYAPISTFLDAAMLGGMIASIDFTRTDGRTTLAFRSQDGMPAEVTNGTTAQQLIANGLNFYGTYSTPSENFTWVYPGSVTGPFLWLDSYINAIWLKNILQNALMELLAAVPSIPYNAAGYALIQEALGGGPATSGEAPGPIQQALNFGAIRVGVTLSAEQVAAVNNAAGNVLGQPIDIATTIVNQGSFLLIGPASPGTRIERGSPPITFWYADGQSVQKLNLQTVEVQ